MPARIAAAVFAAVAYLSFLAASVYSVGFVAGHGVPRSVDHGGPHGSTALALVVDAALLTVFAAQHSVMARPAFKRVWTRVVPKQIERSAYVLIASLLLGLTFWQWRPLPHVVWHASSPILRGVIWAVYAVGWVTVVAMTFAIDHADLTGLRQVTDYVRGEQRSTGGFRLPLPYRIVRHPMMTGFMIAFLATPTMTAGHLLFAGLSCAYIAVAVRLEEHDLRAALPEYAAYAAATPRFIPNVLRLGAILRGPAVSQASHGQSGAGWQV